MQLSVRLECNGPLLPGSNFTIAGLPASRVFRFLDGTPASGVRGRITAYAGITGATVQAEAAINVVRAEAYVTLPDLGAPLTSLSLSFPCANAKAAAEGNSPLQPLPPMTSLTVEAAAYVRTCSSASQSLATCAPDAKAVVLLPRQALLPDQGAASASTATPATLSLRQVRLLAIAAVFLVVQSSRA